MRRLPHDLARRGVNLGDEALHRFAVDRRDLELDFLRFGEERRILHRFHERPPQHCQPLGRDAGRREERAAHHLAREYQAIIAYVVYSQVLKGAEFMNIAGELEKHAAQELSHALIIAQQIDYLGGMPTVEPKPVRTSEKATDMLQFDLDNETETIRNYRERVRQCEELAEYAMSEQIREILIDEQDHQIALATALGKNPPAPRGSK